MGKRRRGNEDKKAKSKFQEVRQEGSAAVRAEAKKAGAEEDDDIEFIRKQNSSAIQKRHKKAENRSKKAEAVVAEESSKSLKESKLPGKSKVKEQVRPKPQIKPPPKKTKKQPVRDKDEEVEEDDEDDEDDDEDDEDDDEGEELVMQPSHYRNQEGYSFEDESGEGSDFEELNVVFDHFNPKEEDFHGIRQFLRDFLSGNPYDVSGLVDLIIAQSGAVGTVVKVAGEAEVYGVTSVVSLTQHRSAECVKQFGRFVLSKCPENHRSTLEALLRDSGQKKNLGLIINERMVNMPNEMALPLMTGLFDEIRWSQEDQPEGDKDKYKFDGFIVLTRVLRFAPSGKRGKKGKKGGREEEGLEECIYLKAEDQAFRSLATIDFEFKMPNREESEGMLSYGLVMVFDASLGHEVVKQVKELVGDEAIRNQVDLDAAP